LNQAGRGFALQQLCDIRDLESLATLAREGSPEYSESAKQFLASALSAQLTAQSGQADFDLKPLLALLKCVASSENKETALFAVSWLVHFKAVSELVTVSVGTNPSSSERYATSISLEAIQALYVLAFSPDSYLGERASALGAFPTIFKRTAHEEVRDFLRQTFPQKFQ
jgi:hypothetical protein